MTASSSASSTSPSSVVATPLSRRRLFLTRFGSKVSLIHRRDELRASKIMQERAFADPKLEIVWNSEIADDQRRRPARGRHAARHRHRRERASCPSTGLFIAIGHDPRSELLTGQVDLDDNGYVLVNHPSTAHQPPRRLRRRRPRRPPLPPGDHRRRHRLRGRPRRRALHRGAGPRRLDGRAGRRDRGGRRGRADRGPEPDARRAPGTSVAALVLTAVDLSVHPKKEQIRGQHRSRDRRRVRVPGPQVRQARPRGLLGGVVRPVPPGAPRSSTRSQPPTATRSPSSR